MPKRASRSDVAPGITPNTELVWCDPRTLDDNPLNWRRHPQRQKAALSAVIKKVGWAGVCLYNRTTKRLIDGHGRKEVAIEQGIAKIPVLMGEWTEEQERIILQSFDPIGAMAQTDAVALDTLSKKVNLDLKKIGGESKQTLRELSSRLSHHAASVAAGDQTPAFLDDPDIEEEDDSPILSGEEKPDSDEPPTHSRIRSAVSADDEPVHSKTVYNVEILYPEVHPYGIPGLRDDRLATPAMIPTSTWDGRKDFIPEGVAWFCHGGRPFPQKRKGGVLGFYTDDWRFESVWWEAERWLNRFLEEDWTALAAPQFSFWESWPFAIVIHNLYRTRWLQRWWQDAGLYTIPDLWWWNGDDSYEWVLGTLPIKPPLASIQCRTLTNSDDPDASWKSFFFGLRDSLSIVKPEHLLIYGAGSQDSRTRFHGAKLPRTTKYHFVNSFMGQRRKVMAKW